MTHTLHPEIKSKLLNIITIMDGQFRSGNMQTSEKTRLWDILMDKLGPYLLPPSQHLKDETLDMKNHRSVLLGWDKGVAGGDSSCDVYGYYNGGKFYITNIEHRVEDNEPLPEKDLSGKIIDGLNKLYVEEELKQSTPKIEPHIQKIQGMGPYNEMTVVESKINELIDDNMRLWDYINNKD